MQKDYPLIRIFIAAKRHRYHVSTARDIYLDKRWDEVVKIIAKELVHWQLTFQPTQPYEQTK